MFVLLLLGANQWALWLTHGLALTAIAWSSATTTSRQHAPQLVTASNMALACAGEGLEQAQMNKLDDLIAQAGICATDHVLDIGFGWGSGAIRAVQTTGCRYDAGTCSCANGIWP